MKEKLILKGKFKQISLIIGIINRIYNGETGITYSNGSGVVIPKDYLKDGFSMKKPKWQVFMHKRRLKKDSKNKRFINPNSNYLL